MATRSRLGRDPLSDVAQPATPPKNTRSGKAKAGPKTAAKRQTTKTAPRKNAEPAETARIQPETPDLDVSEVQASAAVPPAQAVVIPHDEPGIPSQEATPEAPFTAKAEHVASPEAIEETTAAPAMAAATETPSAAGLIAPKTPNETIPETAVVQPETKIADTSPVVSDAAQAPVQLSPDMHPVAVFLRGVLDGLDQDNSIRVSVTVTPSAYALPVEKLFYFSHAIQLIVSPLEWPGNAWKRPVAVQEPFPGLTAILAAYPGGKHSLRIYDNGLFFSSYYPEMSLGMEALRPLMLFITQRNGSICLKQGRAVEVEIIG